MLIKRNTLSFWLKSFVFLLLAASLYYILSRNENLDQLYLQELGLGWKKHPGFLLVAILLFPVNWALESYKWKYLIRKIEKIGFWEAFSGVVSGVSLGLITIHGLGDYAGRILTLKSRDRAKGIGAVFMSRISQFYITLYFGTVSLVYYLYKVIQSDDPGHRLLIWITLTGNIIFILLFIYHKKILSAVSHIRLFSRVVAYFEIIKNYSSGEINYVLIISLVRYLVFCIQFILVLLFFGIDLPLWMLLMGVAFIFFAKSVIPTFLDLGVRETAAVIFFGVFSDAKQNIVFASLTLWIINLVLPSLAGIFLIYRIRIFRKEEK